MSGMPKTGVLFLNLGGPDSLAAVRPFLYNLLSDIDFLMCPGSHLLKKPIAWLISTFRTSTTQDMYRRIGGRSPLLPLTQHQANALTESLAGQGVEISVYIGMRYWHPFIAEAVQAIQRDGIEHLIVLPLFPQYSVTTTGACLEELDRCFKKQGIAVQTTVISHYHQHPAYQDAVATLIREALSQNAWTCPQDQVMVLFSAHSLPVRLVEKTGDVYPRQTVETVTHLMERHFPGQPWQLSYQSKLGNQPWLEPSTDETLHQFARQGTDNILIVPISFVSDHIETLYEIDLVYMPLAQSLKIPRCVRTASLNSHPRFIQALSTLVLEQLDVKPKVHSHV